TNDGQHDEHDQQEQTQAQDELEVNIPELARGWTRSMQGHGRPSRLTPSPTGARYPAPCAGWCWSGSAELGVLLPWCAPAASGCAGWNQPRAMAVMTSSRPGPTNTADLSGAVNCLLVAWEKSQ